MQSSTARHIARLVNVAVVCLIGVFVWSLVKNGELDRGADLDLQRAQASENPTTPAKTAVVIAPSDSSPAAPAAGVAKANWYIETGPYDAELSQEEFQRRSFVRLLAQFDGEPMDQPDWPGFDRQKLAPILVIRSVAAHLDAQERNFAAMDDEQFRAQVQAGGFEYSWSSSDGRFCFNAGEFPVYDEYVRLSHLDSATQQPIGIEPEPERDFWFPEEFFVNASAFAHEGLALMQ
jgi:hypothetical protein